MCVAVKLMRVDKMCDVVRVGEFCENMLTKIFFAVPTTMCCIVITLDACFMGSQKVAV